MWVHAGVLQSSPTTLEQRMLHLVQESAHNKDVGAGRRLHSLILLNGLLSVAVFADYLIRLYASGGSLLEANLVFCQIPSPSIYTWYGIIFAHCTHLQHVRALALYHAMLEQDITPNNYILSCILKACCSIGALYHGMLIHHHAITCDIDSDVIVGSILIDMYAKCGLLKEARTTFDTLPHRNVVSYGTIIAGYAQHECGYPALELFEKMRRNGIKPNRVIFLGILGACSSQQVLQEGQWVHDLIVRNGIELDLAIGNTIVDMYSKCGSMAEAHRVFDTLPIRNIVSWGALITGYVHQEQNSAAFELFRQMQQKGIQPNRVIFLAILNACANMEAVEQGKVVHDQIVENDLESDVLIRSALVKMYVALGNFQKARKLFDESSNQSMVTWSVMLSGYVQHEQDILALQLFEKMQLLDVMPDKFVYTCVLKACGGAEALVEVKLIHNQVIRGGLERDVAVGSSLVDAYAKCGGVKEARRVFDKIPEKNEVSWGAMLAGYNQHGEGFLALELFETMLHNAEKPDKVRLLCVLKACGTVGAVLQGKLIHDLIRRCGVHMDVVLGNALIDMYAKCGELEEAYMVFNGLQDRDIVSWGAMIAGCAQHGLLEMVSMFLLAMQCEGVKPNDKIFSSILSACNHAGLLEEGYHHFRAMIVDHSISPSPEHVNCMVDLLSRVGCLSEAEKFLQSMPSTPDTLAWTSLLTACRTYGNMKFGKHCYEQVIQLNPTVSSGYVTMSNIFADAHMWDSFNGIHDSRKSAGAWKKPGKAWIEVDNGVHEFIVDDKIHPQVPVVHANLKRWRGILKETGYVPNLDPLGAPLCKLISPSANGF